MSHPVYTRQSLESKKLADLKAIAKERGITPEGNKAHKQTWIDAIEKIQSNAIWRNAYAKTEEVKPVATCSESALLVEMNGDECVVNGEIVAAITSDDNLTQPWLVSINCVEVHRAATWARCYDYVRTHVKYGTLPNPQSEQIDDYLFHDDPQPAKPTQVGDSHFIGSILLRCIEVASESASVWDVIKDGSTVGEISMSWDCFWTHTLSFQSFATPQEAVVNLIESAAELITQPEFEIYPTDTENLFAVMSYKSGKHYQVSLTSNSCTCPHWSHRHGQEGFRDKHIDAVKSFLQSCSREQHCYQLK